MAKYVVYLVDDDIEFLDALSLLLESSGWKTLSFSNAKTFLNGYPPSEPCIVLLDAKMAPMSGIDVLEEILKKRNSDPIIFLTGHGDIDLAVYVLTHGASDFIQKPITPEKLFRTLANAENKIEEVAKKNLELYRELAWNTLTEQELNILTKLSLGLTNQQIAEIYGISSRTVETHAETKTT